MVVTAYANIFSKEPHYITVEQALERIKSGKSASKVSEIRTALDKNRANELKKNLPSICFSGKFGANRQDADLIEHSTYIVLDFDNVNDVEARKVELYQKDFIYAVWVSPSGNGVKALVKIASPEKHREHFAAIRDIFPEIDKSGVNPSRVCYESFDPELMVKSKTVIFDKVKTAEVVQVQKSNNEAFQNILKWLANKGDAFRTGERNAFLYKLASACCRFGILESECEQEFVNSFLAGVSDFSRTETIRTIKSAYKANSASFGTATFESSQLVNKTTKVEVEYNIYDLSVKPKDVIYGEDVKSEALDIYLNGYLSAETTGIAPLDNHFKWKKGEITLLSGIGNYGKSTYLRYLLLMKVILNGDKFALFAPEDTPAQEFYFDLVEMYLGQKCTPDMLSRPSMPVFQSVYDWISKHIFFIYPETVSPTPEYIKERFLELIVKEGVTGCVIDPFNQMYNDYSSTGGRDDKYLEIVLADFTRFARINEQFFVIVAHPKSMTKPKDSLNYSEPDVYDLAGGAMWNNKMDNILIYHRPHRGEDPNNPICTHNSAKIRRQKIVGLLGIITFELSKRARRFLFNGIDYMEIAIAKQYKQEPKKLENNNDFLTPDIVVREGEHDF